ncbi:tetraacyldisaccharide 4'-kinase [Methylobacter sp. Wu8]|uniref:tetraacyldisaccharide 4'-kinase n=1 Tax=Methylobacter sp. Wu8 TaxID=3118457 RepID=UPI002F2E2FB1
MKKTLSRWLVDIWYKDPFIGVWLMPLGFVFSDFVKFRKFLYRIGVLKKHSLPVPVIVIGNITVGGTGKTPLIIWLAELLKSQGFKPGIISRGYGGQAEVWPQWVDANSTAEQVGDEALLIAKQTACPMAVSPLRADAGKLLLEKSDCNVILSDDGLQHYALNRDIEIAVIDGERRFGNGYCLPAGPLREPIERLQSVDFRVVNGEKAEDNEFSMQITGNTAVNLATGHQKPLQEFNVTGCHALAGIGNPDRFFKLLESAGLTCKTHSFPDHYKFQVSDILFSDSEPVLMTEKDAVKCMAFAGDRHWFVPVKAVPEMGLAEQLLGLLREKIKPDHVK